MGSIPKTYKLWERRSLMEWNEKQRKTAAGSILIGVAAIAITTVVMAAGMGGGPGGGGPGGLAAEICR